MRLLFDLGHPAHVHLFRNLVKKVQEDGGEALCATRKKDVTTELCSLFNIPQVVLSRANRGGLFSGGLELMERTLRLILVALKFRPDALLGTSMSIGFVGRFIGRPSFVFNEDDADAVRLLARISYPTCTYIVTPECLKHEGYGSKHLTYPGYHELAYLHPDHFVPDPGVPRSIGLDPSKPYFILRFVALLAYHDSGASGLPYESVEKLVDMLASKGKVIITSEGEVPGKLERLRFSMPPDKLHDLLAFSSMCISDSQTVTAEAAVLGVPNLRCNSFVGRISYLEELEKDYGLTKGFLPSEIDSLFTVVEEWLPNLSNVRNYMQQGRRTMLEKSVNLADWQWAMLRKRLYT